MYMGLISGSTSRAVSTLAYKEKRTWPAMHGALLDVKC